MGNKVYIDLVARTARLEKGVAQANKHLKRFQRQGARVSGMLKTMARAAFAYVGVRAMRNPMYKFILPGTFQKRVAERQLVCLTSHEPPRNTR